MRDRATINAIKINAKESQLVTKRKGVITEKTAVVCPEGKE
jgi:hypothetical protein